MDEGTPQETCRINEEMACAAVELLCAVRAGVHTRFVQKLSLTYYTTLSS